ncbi:sensor histidine kinase [Desulfobacula phenolica]|uniref:histidine kinase n=1 Tax=Desulfobacula phenolica TaxID=90732 RepID=A0A1H2ELW4_9BACT|nr:ATP-binding protein [Desulfobacula phenolica]SDT96107.1 Signal transduction histidine kinase [Desulfobacula phenolica]
MEPIDIRFEKQQQQIKELKQRNEKLEQFYCAYKKRHRCEGERIRELNCLCRVAQCVVSETDMDVALDKIVCIIPHGWQYSKESCARITFKDTTYLSPDFFESSVFQTEKILIENKAVGSIEVFYPPGLGLESKIPFLIEERNLLKAIANIISFYVIKQRDDENRKLIQHQLLHADRLATIGQLSAGVAHELNEPLGNILGLAQLALKLPEMPDQAKKDLGKIEECVIYSREIIKKLMEFSRQTSLCKKTINLNEAIDSSIIFLEARCVKEGIKIVKHYANAITITADPNQIKQVITNLTINAIQAMKNGGKLTFTTRKNNENVILSVEDTGIGISGENISKTFMPFFTTKDVGEGTGLGLSVVYGIVRNHNGDIKVSSEPGKGTIFEVCLPLEEK